MYVKIYLLQLHVYYAPTNLKLQYPPLPWAFELLKIGSFKFQSLGPNLI